MVLECPRARRLPAPHQLPDGWCSGSPTRLEKQTMSKAKTVGVSTSLEDKAAIGMLLWMGATWDGSPLPCQPLLSQGPHLSFPQIGAA